MELPVWHFVGIGSGLIIGIVSVLHVFVAQFAVGGGIYLVWMERRAYRDGAPEILQWLERHTHFFLLLTMVFGGLSGVGIWFTMSVVNPGATSMLIHNFVFFWAAEWGLFLLEVVSLLAYYYTYPWSRSGRMSPETHMRIGIVYACAGFLSLVLIAICGILHGFGSEICIFMAFYTAIEGALLSNGRKQSLFFTVLTKGVYLLLFPVMLVTFTCYELGFEEYALLVPVFAVAGVVVLMIGALSYFLYDPYRMDRRNRKKANRYIVEIEKAALKEVRLKERAFAKQEKKQAKFTRKEEARAQKKAERDERRRQRKEARAERHARWRAWWSEKLARLKFVKKESADETHKSPANADTTEEHSAEGDSVERESAERDSAEAESAERESAEEHSTEGEVAKRD